MSITEDNSNWLSQSDEPDLGNLLNQTQGAQPYSSVQVSQAEATSLLESASCSTGFDDQSLDVYSPFQNQGTQAQCPSEIQAFSRKRLLTVRAVDNHDHSVQAELVDHWQIFGVNEPSVVYDVTGLPGNYDGNGFFYVDNPLSTWSDCPYYPGFRLGNREITCANKWSHADNEAWLDEPSCQKDREDVYAAVERQKSRGLPQNVIDQLRVIKQVQDKLAHKNSNLGPGRKHQVEIHKKELYPIMAGLGLAGENRIAGQGSFDRPGLMHRTNAMRYIPLERLNSEGTGAYISRDLWRDFTQKDRDLPTNTNKSNPAKRSNRRRYVDWGPNSPFAQGESLQLYLKTEQSDRVRRSETSNKRKADAANLGDDQSDEVGGIPPDMKRPRLQASGRQPHGSAPIVSRRKAPKKSIIASRAPEGSTSIPDSTNPDPLNFVGADVTASMEYQHQDRTALPETTQTLTDEWSNNGLQNQYGAADNRLTTQTHHAALNDPRHPSPLMQFSPSIRAVGQTLTGNGVERVSDSHTRRLISRSFRETYLDSQALQYRPSWETGHQNAIDSLLHNGMLAGQAGSKNILHDDGLDASVPQNPAEGSSSRQSASSDLVSGSTKSRSTIDQSSLQTPGQAAASDGLNYAWTDDQLLDTTYDPANPPDAVSGFAQTLQYPAFDQADFETRLYDILANATSYMQPDVDSNDSEDPAQSNKPSPF